MAANKVKVSSCGEIMATILAKEGYSCIANVYLHPYQGGGHTTFRIARCIRTSYVHW